MRRPALALAFLILIPAPIAAHVATSEFAQNLRELRNQDRMVQRVGWKLASTNSEFCSDTIYRTGLQIDDADAYRSSDAVRSVNGITGDIFIQSIVPGSPAAKAGLAEGQEIAAIADIPVSETLFEPERPWMRTEQLRENITQHLGTSSSIPITIAGGRAPAIIEAVKVCSSTFEVVTGRNDAVANGRRVAIGRAFKGFGYPEDEFAAALAHELAHNLLGHSHWLEKAGRNRRNIRETEREADRLMPWLLANAGYDPAAAARFMRKAKPGHGGGLFRSPSHDNWNKRVEAIEAEIRLVKASQTRHSRADWKADFVPQFSRD